MSMENDFNPVPKEVLDEEKKRLAKVLTSIHTDLEKAEDDSIHPWKGNTDFQTLLGKQIAERTTKELTQMSDSPYYGRIDLEIDGKSETIYIGQFAYEDEDSRTTICSGYSPIGQFFAQKTKASGEYNNTKYEAFLRRNLLIERGILKTVHDVYERGIDPKYNGITDPYLKEILRRNRRNSQMVSILPSIQENQANIVYEKTDASFVVQGCAGSGKTAIVFQRLASIDYRQRGFIDRSVRFITPNHGFNDFVGPLASSLGLDQIKPITMADYYLELADRYGIKLSSENTRFEDDYGLDPDFIIDVYSDSTILSLFNAGQTYIDSVLDGIDLEELATLLAPFGMERLDDDRRYKLTELTSFLNKASVLIGDEVYKDLQRRQSDEELWLAEISSPSSPLKQPSGSLPQAEKVDALAKSLAELVERINASLAKAEDEQGSRLFLKCPTAFDDKAIFNEQVCRLEESVTESESLKADQLSSLLEEKALIEENLNQLTSALSELEKELEALKASQQSLGFFSFIRRRKMEDRITEIKAETVAKAQEKQDAVGRKAIVEAEITRLRPLGEVQDELKPLIAEAKALARVYFAASGLLNQTAIVENEKRLIEMLPRLQAILKGGALEFKTVHKKVASQIIQNLRQRHNIAGSSGSAKINGSYHVFNLYLSLTLATLFLPSPSRKDKLLIIDEGQEYSPNEYALIMDANSRGDNPPPINVFGDLNQRSSPKGIKNWESITIAGEKVHVLKENYRNSREIVEFCNRELHMSDVAIGLEEGIPVRVIHPHQAVAETKDGGLCVIVKEGTLGYQRFEQSGLSHAGLEILSPVMAKGREFEKVIVFDEGMDAVDKYVSYTRGKAELIVCRQ